MKCPHCMTAAYMASHRCDMGGDPDGHWYCVYGKCPNCNRLIVFLQNVNTTLGSGGDTILELALGVKGTKEVILVRPKGSQRPACPPQVPGNIADDYKEACLVLSDSPKASAALSRRCLQNLLREKAGVKPANLANEIEEAMKSLPTYLVEQIDAVRNIGNFAAHPIKSQNTGQIQPVEPGEAEWNLDILEALFDYYCVKPDEIQKKRQALDRKLGEAGQKPMK